MHAGTFQVPVETGDGEKAVATFHDEGFKRKEDPVLHSDVDRVDGSGPRTGRFEQAESRIRREVYVRFGEGFRETCRQKGGKALCSYSTSKMPKSSRRAGDYIDQPGWWQ